MKARRITGDHTDRDAASFIRLVEDHNSDMQRVAYLICGNVEQARDAAQAAWENAWRRLPDSDPGGQRAWLITVAANAAKRELRRNRLRSILERRLIEPQAAAPGGGEEAMDLRLAYRKLGKRDQRILSLRYALDLTSAEIAPIVGLSPSGVRVRLVRVLERLRKELN